MAFNQNDFAPVGANSTDSPAIFSYTTPDTALDVVSVNYFAAKELQLREGDVILSVTSDAFSILQIGADTSTAIPEFVGGQSNSGFLGIYANLAALELAHPGATTTVGSTATVIDPNSNLYFVNSSNVWQDSGTGFIGDMLKAMYDPTNIESDAFSMGNMVETATALVFNNLERAKLSGIEDGAEVNQSDAEIKAQYEANPDTNAFTDGEQIKLGSIETNAQVNPDASEVKVLYESNADTNAFTDAGQTKLAGIEAGAEVNPTDTDGLSEGSTNLYYTEARVSSNTDVAANTAARHAAVTLNADSKTQDALILTGQEIQIKTDVYDKANQTGVDQITGTISAFPAVSTGQDDYEPVGFQTSNLVRINVTSDSDFTGFAAPPVGVTRVMYLVNVTTTGNKIKLINNDAGSVAANRMILPDNSDYDLKENGSAILIYDHTSARWRAVSIQE